jgi:hypothetical protein
MHWVYQVQLDCAHTYAHHRYIEHRTRNILHWNTEIVIVPCTYILGCLFNSCIEFIKFNLIARARTRIIDISNTGRARARIIITLKHRDRLSALHLHLRMFIWLMHWVSSSISWLCTHVHDILYIKHNALTCTHLPYIETQRLSHQVYLDSFSRARITLHWNREIIPAIVRFFLFTHDWVITMCLSGPESADAKRFFSLHCAVFYCLLMIE